jgi:uncharacterized protein (TIGR03086 family)
MLDLRPAAAEVSRLLPGVDETRLDGPTPCADYDLGGLIDHLMALSLAFTWAADKQAPPADADESPPGKAEGTHLHPDWRTLLPQRLDGLAAAWARPRAWEGETSVAGVTLPAPQFATIALDEVVLHGWDLARATGQEYRPDPAAVGPVLGFVTGLARPEQAEFRAGLFGPIVEVAPDASDFERALGLAGRDPHWSRSQGPGSRPAR